MNHPVDIINMTCCDKCVLFMSIVLLLSAGHITITLLGSMVDYGGSVIHHCPQLAVQCLHAMMALFLIVHYHLHIDMEAFAC